MKKIFTVDFHLVAEVTIEKNEYLYTPIQMAEAARTSLMPNNFNDEVYIREQSFKILDEKIIEDAEVVE